MGGSLNFREKPPDIFLFFYRAPSSAQLLQHPHLLLQQPRALQMERGRINGRAPLQQTVELALQLVGLPHLVPDLVLQRDPPPLQRRLPFGV